MFKNKKMRQFLSAFLAFVMCLSLLPVQILADDGNSNEENVEVVNVVDEPAMLALADEAPTLTLHNGVVYKSDLSPAAVFAAVYGSSTPNAISLSDSNVDLEYKAYNGFAPAELNVWHHLNYKPYGGFLNRNHKFGSQSTETVRVTWTVNGKNIVAQAQVTIMDDPTDTRPETVIAINGGASESDPIVLTYGSDYVAQLNNYVSVSADGSDAGVQPTYSGLEALDGMAPGETRTVPVTVSFDGDENYKASEDQVVYVQVTAPVLYYTVNVAAVSNGTVTVNGSADASVSVVATEGFTVAAVPAQNYSVVSVTVKDAAENVVASTTEGSLTVTAAQVAANAVYTVSAEFADTRAESAIVISGGSSAENPIVLENGVDYEAALKDLVSVNDGTGTVAGADVTVSGLDALNTENAVPVTITFAGNGDVKPAEATVYVIIKAPVVVNYELQLQDAVIMKSQATAAGVEQVVFDAIYVSSSPVDVALSDVTLEYKSYSKLTSFGSDKWDSLNYTPDRLNPKHAFGDKDVEEVRVTWNVDGKKLVSYAKVTISKANSTTMEGGKVVVVYGSDLKEAVLEKVTVLDVNGNKVPVTADDITLKPDSLNASPLTAQKVKVTFKGNVDYKSSECTVDVYVLRALGCINVKSEIITVGQTPKLEVVTKPANLDYIRVIAGIDGEATGFVSIDIPASTKEAMKIGIPGILEFDIYQFLVDRIGDGVTLQSLSAIIEEAVALMDIIPDEFYHLINFDIDALRQIANIIGQVPTLGMKTKITLANAPKNPGLYLVGAVSTDRNYTLAMDLGNLTILPKIVIPEKTCNELRFDNVMGENNVLTYEEAQTFGFGGSLFSGSKDAMVKVESSHVRASYQGVTAAGKPVSSDKPIREPGCYTETIYVLGGDKLAAPIFRAYTVQKKPAAEEAELVLHDGTVVRSEISTKNVFDAVFESSYPVTISLDDKNVDIEYKAYSKLTSIGTDVWHHINYKPTLDVLNPNHAFGAQNVEEVRVTWKVDGKTIVKYAKVTIVDPVDPPVEPPVVEENYTVTVGTMTNGTVRVDGYNEFPMTVKADLGFTVTTWPEDGYEAVSITVTDSNDNVVATAEADRLEVTAAQVTAGETYTVNAVFTEIAPPPVVVEPDLVLHDGTINRSDISPKNVFAAVFESSVPETISLDDANVDIKFKAYSKLTPIGIDMWHHINYKPTLDLLNPNHAFGAQNVEEVRVTWKVDGKTIVKYAKVTIVDPVDPPVDPPVVEETYTVTVGTMTNGTVRVDGYNVFPMTVKADLGFTVTTWPEDGYEAVSIIVTDSTGNVVATAEADRLEVTAAQVTAGETYTVNAVFSAIEQPPVVVDPVITLNDDTVTYDGQPHGLTAEVTPDGTAVSYLYTGTCADGLSYLSSDAPVKAGVYSVTAYVTGKEPTEIYDTAILTINPAEVTVTIASVSKEQKAEDPELTCSVTAGTVADGDDLGVVLERAPGEDAGKYAITGTASNANYIVTFVNGELTIRGAYKLVDSAKNLAGVGVTAEEMAEAVAQDGDEALLDAGKDICFWIESVEVSATDEQKAQIQTAAGKDYKPAQVIDITVWRQVSGEDPVQLHQLKKEITLVIPVPRSAIAAGRNYHEVRFHDGAAETLGASVDTKNYTVTCKSDKFSGFAFVYKEAPQTNPTDNPKTGDFMKLGGAFGVLALALIAMTTVVFLVPTKKGKYSR